MRITLARSGGFGGIRPAPVIVDTEKLPAAQARKLEALVESSGVRTAASSPKSSSPAQPDRFSYTLTLSEPSGREQSVTLPEQELSPELQTLLDAIKHRGRP